jgi:uncharacterized lipoprotein YbaY
MAVTLAYCLVLSCPTPGLAQRQLAVDGTATYRERMALPPDAVFEATLIDVSRVDDRPLTSGAPLTMHHPVARLRARHCSSAQTEEEQTNKQDA